MIEISLHFVVLLIVLCNILFSAQSACSSGKWIKSEDILSTYDGYRSNTDEFDIQDWTKISCPAEIFMHNCYYIGNHSRASYVERNIYQFDDSSCIGFDPIGFLSLLKDKALIITGDSLMMQIWQSIVCSLYKHAISHFNIQWRDEAKDYPIFYNRTSCPLHKKQCHMQRIFNTGSVYYPEYNVTILLDQSPDLGTLKYRFDSLQDSQIHIINLGAWYNLKGKLIRAIKQLKDLIQKYENKLKSNLFYLHTLPQHFKTNNGYFDYGIHDISYSGCQPLIQVKNDWRNDIIDTNFMNDSRIQIIPIAKAVHERWDTHVSLSKYRNGAQDCTHYCLPSGVFEYAKAMIFNALIKTRTTIVE